MGGALASGFSDDEFLVRVHKLAEAAVIFNVLAQSGYLVGWNPTAAVGSIFPRLMLEIRAGAKNAALWSGFLAVFFGKGAVFHGFDLSDLLKDLLARLRGRTGHGCMSV